MRLLRCVTTVPKNTYLNANSGVNIFACTKPNICAMGELIVMMEAMNLPLCVTTALIQNLPCVRMAVSVLKMLTFAMATPGAQTAQMSQGNGPRPNRSLLGQSVLSVDRRTQFLVQGLEMCAPLFAMAGLSALTGGMNFYPHARLMKRLALRKTVFIRAKTAQCVLIQHESVTVGGIATSVERMNPLSPANIHAIRQTLSPVTTIHVFG